MAAETRSPRFFLALDATFEGGRMFVGAIGAAYLLSRGLSLAEIAQIKLIQGSIMIAGEVPTGVLADTLGRRFSLLLSVTCALAGFVGYALGSSFWTFAAAEALLALSLCFWSGAFEAYALDRSGIGRDPAAVARFFQQNQALGQATVMISGLLGGVLAASHFEVAYWLSAATFVGVGFALLLGPSDPKSRVNAEEFIRVKFAHHARAIWKEGLNDPRVAKFFWINLAVQAAIQPLIHYWQPYFQELSPGIDGAGLGLVFFTFCAATSLAGWLVSRWLRGALPDSVRLSLVGPMAFAIAGIAWVGLGASSTYAFGLIWICILQASLATGRSRLAAGLAFATPPASRASVISGASLFSRFGMLASLATLGATLGPSKLDGALASTYVVTGFAITACVVAIALGRAYRRQPEKTGCHGL